MWRPVAFFSSIFFNRSRRTSWLGVFKENELSDGDKNDLASTSPTGISRATVFAMLVTCTLKASAISPALFISLDFLDIGRLAAIPCAKLVSKIPSFTLIAFASFQVFRKISFFSKLSYIILLVSPRLNCCRMAWSFEKDYFLFKKISSMLSELSTETALFEFFLIEEARVCPCNWKTGFSILATYHLDQSAN